MIPPKLQPGDEVRVLAPSLSQKIIHPLILELAKERLLQLGLKVSYSAHAEEIDEFDSSPIHSRIDDLHTAFRDPAVKGILTVIGGYNCNQLLNSLDYDLIRHNPKIFCGYSDITALQNAIYNKTDLVTYSGPHFSTFGCLKGLEYTLKHFKNCLFDHAPLRILPSDSWSDDTWYIDQKNRSFIPNEGFWTIQEGSGNGPIVGGNLTTFSLLQGTEFMPSLKDRVLFIEEDLEASPHSFESRLQSLLLQPHFNQAIGMVIGRFQKQSKMTRELLTKIIQNKKELRGLPILANVDFGHTQPIITFPIGGELLFDFHSERTSLVITKH